MDNEQDYIDLYKLLARCKFNIAKCKFNIAKEQAKFSSANMEHTLIISYYDKKIKQIDEFIVDIPIIIKGDEF